MTITPLNDALAEGDETVVLTLVDGASYDLGAQTSATVIIADDDLGTVTVVATDATAAEAGNDTGTFTFTRTGDTSLALVVNFTVGGTAMAGADYLNNLSTQVTFQAGQTSVTRTVTPVLDTLLEGNETVVVTLAPGAYIVGAPASATVTIEDHVPVVTVVATDAAASEVGPDTGTFTITRTGDLGVALVVNYTVGGTATAGSDYLNNLSTQVTIQAGQTSVTRTVTPVLDALLEGQETVVLTLAAGEYQTGAQSSATVTIADTVPVVTVAATDATATEAGATTGTFTITRTGDLGVALTVNYTIGGTATAGSDYLNNLNTQVTIQAGQASATRTVTSVDDAVAQGNETVVLTLAAGEYQIGAQNSATVTITSNE